MFRNWIDPLEPIHLLKRLRRDPALRQRILGRIRPGRTARVITTWSDTGRSPDHWWEIPLIRERMRRMITGDAGLPYQEYVVRRHLRAATPYTALSLGCGSGEKEVEWAGTGRFRSIDAYDISASRIKSARESLESTPFGEIIRYQVGDAHRLNLPPDTYDAVLFDHALHHFSSLDSLLLRVGGTLRPGGIVVANEFIGPSRFQWTDRQLEAVNELLAGFPPRYTTRRASMLSREKVRRPSKLAMWLSDPSEAVESSEIMPLIHKHFDVLEERCYGGAILHLLYSGIAHHFVSPDEEALHLLERSMSVEDALLHAGEIGHDFALVVARKQE